MHAIVRLKQTALRNEYDKIAEVYFEEQQHLSLEQFLKFHLSQTNSRRLMMQVTTHSHLLTEEELIKIGCDLSYKVFSFVLQEFDTELDFSSKIKYVNHAITYIQYVCIY